MDALYRLTFDDLWPAHELKRRMTDVELAKSVRRGDLVRVCHGWYASSQTWRDLRPSERHLRTMAAVAQGLNGSAAALSHTSAAVLRGLPVVRAAVDAVHLTDERSRGGGPRHIIRHQVALREEEIDVIDGIRVTSLARTVMDTVRAESRECGIAVADAALRQVAWDPATRTYDHARAEQWRADIQDSLSRAARAPGSRRAAEILSLADGRAESPGESISRLYFGDLGFTGITLQVPIIVAGRHYDVDFGLDDAGAWGEFDGRGKYLDPALTGGADPRDILDREKEREDAIRAATGRTFVRWQWEHIADARTFERFLASRGVRP